MEVTELISKRGKVILPINKKKTNNLNTKWAKK